jgi:hypothetical protein
MMMIVEKRKLQTAEAKMTIINMHLLTSVARSNLLISLKLTLPHDLKPYLCVSILCALLLSQPLPLLKQLQPLRLNIGVHSGGVSLLVVNHARSSL